MRLCRMFFLAILNSVMMITPSVAKTSIMTEMTEKCLSSQFRLVKLLKQSAVIDENDPLVSFYLKIFR